ncbi:hypothetical protein NP522_15920 [Pseudomonas guariconensis]|uniref:hypothetical protein n=1 Tax=Pseudomonas guariconensis TaxID=1288410 RepID=UPI0023636B2D|nr:hypothetical protein [Pseudomonas guariconensis]MDD2091671.1 hypothetical protein [Pseudomonas guariconensis]
MIRHVEGHALPGREVAVASRLVEPSHLPCIVAVAVRHLDVLRADGTDALAFAKR